MSWCINCLHNRVGYTNTMRNIRGMLQQWVPRWICRGNLHKLPPYLLERVTPPVQVKFINCTSRSVQDGESVCDSDYISQQNHCYSHSGTGCVPRQTNFLPSYLTGCYQGKIYFQKQKRVIFKHIKYHNYCSSVRHYSQCVEETNEEDKVIGQKNHQSSLYVSHKDQFNLATVIADLNLEQRFKNLNKLHANVTARGMDLNVYELYSKYKELQDIRHQVKQIESKKQKIIDAITELRDGREVSAESSKQFETLKSQVREIKSELKPVIEVYKDVEEEVTLEALNLPNDLHQTTPQESVILEELWEKPDFACTPKSHVELAERTHSVTFSTVSPGAYYLQGRLSHVQYRLECYIDNLLQEAGLTPFVCPDKVKSVVLEGSGYDIHDSQAVFTIQKKSQEVAEELDQGLLKLDNTYHLTGVSPMAFNAYLTRVNVSEASLPLKYYSIGNTYSPGPLYSTQSYPSLLTSPQVTLVELFGAARNSTELESIYKEYLSIMEDFYKVVGLPVRYVQVGVAGLDKMEASRVDTEIWMPSVNSYVKVGCVSLWNDYASRRLMMKYSTVVAETMNKNYIHTVHSTVVNMPVFIAALMENTQTKMGHFEIPEQVVKVLGLEC